MGCDASIPTGTIKLNDTKAIAETTISMSSSEED